MSNGSRECLEEHLERDEQELAVVLAGLRDRVRSQIDVRHHIVEQPSAWLFGALLFGFWLGARR